MPTFSDTDLPAVPTYALTATVSVRLSAKAFDELVYKAEVMHDSHDTEGMCEPCGTRANDAEHIGVRDLYAATYGDSPAAVRSPKGTIVTVDLTAAAAALAVREMSNAAQIAEDNIGSGWVAEYRANARSYDAAAVKVMQALTAVLANIEAHDWMRVEVGHGDLPGTTVFTSEHDTTDSIIMRGINLARRTAREAATREEYPAVHLLVGGQGFEPVLVLDASLKPEAPAVTDAEAHELAKWADEELPAVRAKAVARTEAERTADRKAAADATWEASPEAAAGMQRQEVYTGPMQSTPDTFDPEHAARVAADLEADADPVTFTDGDGVVWNMAYAKCSCGHALALEDRKPYGSMGRMFVCPGCGMRSDEPTFEPAEVAYLGEAGEGDSTCSIEGCERMGDPSSDGGYRCERHPWAVTTPADRGPKGYTAYPGGKPGTCGACGWDGYGAKPTTCGWCSESAVPLLDLDDVARGYMTAAAWADAMPNCTCGFYGEQVNGTPTGREALMDHLDDCPANESGGLQGEEFAPGEAERVKAHVREFIAANRVHAAIYAERRAFDPAEGTIGDYFGHDLRLTEGGHGTGFWDRNASEHIRPEQVVVFIVARDHLADAARAIYAPDCWQQADGTLTFDLFPAELAAQVGA